MYEETRRLDVELLADILADLNQGATALAALARIGFMAMFDAHQMSRQRLAAGAWAGADFLYEPYIER